MACDGPRTITLKNPFIHYDGKLAYSVPVPCGRCGACRKRKVDEWSFRLRQQKLVADSAHFVTLTYAPEFCPVTPNKFMTLKRDDITKYFKRLRKWMKDDTVKLRPFKFYLVGEYGTTTSRPHYHGIFFNATRDHINEAWCDIRNGQKRANRPMLGHVHIGSVTSDSIAYCVKYLDKGRTVPVHNRDDRVREFSRSSHHLGANYLTPAMLRWHRADLSRNYAWNGDYKIALPKYYRDRIYTKAMKREQWKLAQAQLEENDYIARKSYFELYPDHTDSDYLLDKEFQKEARYNKYVKHGKKRKF